MRATHAKRLVRVRSHGIWRSQRILEIGFTVSGALLVASTSALAAPRLNGTTRLL